MKCYRRDWGAGSWEKVLATQASGAEFRPLAVITLGTVVCICYPLPGKQRDRGKGTPGALSASLEEPSPHSVRRSLEAKVGSCDRVRHAALTSGLHVPMNAHIQMYKTHLTNTQMECHR